jgi:hypothetical protein
LQSGDKDALFAFDYGIWSYNRKEGMEFQAAFDLEFASGLKKQKVIITGILNIFGKLHGYN